MELTKHENNVLISLYREYTKNEKLSFLIRVCKERGEEIGILKSEIEELKYNLTVKQNTEDQVERIKVDINDLIESMSFNDNHINNSNSVSTLNEYKTELLRVKELYGKKHWYISYLFSLINSRQSHLKRNTRAFSEFIVDVIREKFTEEEFRALIDEAYKKEAEFKSNVKS